MARRGNGSDYDIAEVAFGESGSTVGDVGRGTRGNGCSGTGSRSGDSIGVGDWEVFVFVVVNSFEELGHVRCPSLLGGYDVRRRGLVYLLHGMHGDG